MNAEIYIRAEMHMLSESADLHSLLDLRLNTK